MNVTFVPGQIEVKEEDIETDGETGFVTLIVIVLLFAVEPFTQGELLVKIQLTISPVAREEVLKVALFVPTGMPFWNHA